MVQVITIAHVFSCVSCLYIAVTRYRQNKLKGGETYFGLQIQRFQFIVGLLHCKAEYHVVREYGRRAAQLMVDRKQRESHGEDIPFKNMQLSICCP
jgi:hypothetical protein